MNEQDNKTTIAALTFVIAGLDDATDKFRNDCMDLRDRLEK